MFKFFTPTTKVQKDRAIMRETDARLAKYSRRGVIFNFVAFLLVMVGGDFVEKQQGLAIVLTIGLLLLTFLRGFFLFRFEHLYPRAPAKWRDRYFFATLLGAAWWGVILVSVTLVLQMQNEAPLLWLYTVVFFSTTAHAFAPYQRFLTVYQFMGQVPAAIAAFFIPDLNAWLFGTVMLAFYFMLVHQCRLMSEDYWQKLAATYALAKKTENLEQEKRGTRALAQLNQEFMNNLYTELNQVVQMTDSGVRQLQHTDRNRRSVAGIKDAQTFQSRIFSSVEDFRNLLTKELTLDSRVFNVRHEMQSLIRDSLDRAETRNIQIESALSPTIPMRLKGDAGRFAQIIRTTLSTVIERSHNSFLLVEADFLREFETSGDLQVTVSRHAYSRKRFFQPQEQDDNAGSLDLSVCKGLAESMDGTLSVEGEGDQFQVRFRAKFTVPEVNSQMDFQRDTLEGHSILLIHPHTALIDVKRRELDALGLSVRTESQYRRAYQTLVNSYRENAPIECVLYYMHADHEEALEFSKSLLNHKELRNTHQLIACTEATRQQPDIQALASETSVHLLMQPTGLYELGTNLYEIYRRDQLLDESAGAADGRHRRVRAIYVDTGEGNADIATEKLVSLGIEVEVVPVDRLDRITLDEQDPKLILLECVGETSQCPQVVDQIRQLEADNQAATLMPVIAVGWHKVSNFYEQGFDHFVDLNQEAIRISATLRYWANL